MVGGAQEVAVFVGLEFRMAGKREVRMCHLWTCAWDVTKVHGGVNPSAGHDANTPLEDSTGLLALSSPWLPAYPTALRA